MARQRLRKQNGLVVLSFGQSQPVQRDWNNQRVLICDDGFGRLGQPSRSGPKDIVPISVFQRQNKPARAALVQHRCAAPPPRPRVTQAIVTQRAFIRGRLTRQRQPTGITDRSADERRFRPAIGTKAKVAGHKSPTADTSGGIDRLKGHLKSGLNTHRVRAMSPAPRLIDDQRRAAALQRASDPILQRIAIDDVQDRLTMVKKDFQAPAIVTPMPDVWRAAFPHATICAQAETLPLKTAGHDLVVHALGLHWANDPIGQLIQCRRALHPDGLLLAVTLGGQTLHELRACLAEAETRISGGLSPRVAPMGEIRDLGALLQRAGLALPVADSESLTLSYRDMFHLMQDLRKMGETNALAGRVRHGTRRAIFEDAARLYAQHHTDPQGRITATFEFVTLTGWMPDASQPQPLRPGSATNRLADALGSAEYPLKD